MDVLKLGSFANLRELQNTIALLAIAKAAGIETVDDLSRHLQQSLNRETVSRERERKSALKKQPTNPHKKPKQKTTKQKPQQGTLSSPFTCPECDRGNLHLKRGQEGFYVGCPECYLAKLVFEDK